MARGSGHGLGWLLAWPGCLDAALAAPRRRGRLASSGKAFSWISLPKPWPGQAQTRLSLAFPYQSHDLARPRQGFLLHFLTKATIWPGSDQKIFKNLHVFSLYSFFSFFHLIKIKTIENG